jgi:hypothetical protein
MSTESRLYLVTNKISDYVTLVEATSAAQARNHVAAKLLEVKAANPKEIAGFFEGSGNGNGVGMKVERAGAGNGKAAA